MIVSRIDLVIGIFVGLFCIIGFFKGAIRQFFSIVAFISAGIISAVIPCLVKLPVGKGLSPVWGYLILAVLIWIPAYLILNSIGKIIAGRLVKKGVRPGDRLWGLVFGGLKGIIIVVLAVFLIDSFPQGIKQYFPSVREAMAGSKVISFIQPYNPFLKLHIMENLRTVISSVNDPDYMELLKDDPGFRKLIQQESIKAVLNDPELKEILKKQEYFRFITHPKVQQLIKDPEALRLLLTTDINKALIGNI